MWRICIAAWMGWTVWIFKTRAHTGPRCIPKPVIRPLIGDHHWKTVVAQTKPDSTKTTTMVRYIDDYDMIVFFGP